MIFMHKTGSGDGTVAPDSQDPQGVETPDPAQHTAAQQEQTEADREALRAENEQADGTQGSGA